MAERITPETSISGESTATAFLKSLGSPLLRKATVKTIGSIFYHFFFCQYRAALLPGRIPVSSVDHPLDAKIPFAPSWVAVYLDFVAFWVRILSFLLRAYRRRVYKSAGEFVESMGRLYAFAGEVYRKNLSTTKRPFYIRRPRFLLIHLVDPHLMCIPSLHVMVVIRAYTKFRAVIRGLGDEARFARQIDEIIRGALAITEAILFVKQHSVNCVAAAMYAMTCFEGPLFPPEEAELFASRLFTRSLPPEDAEILRTHIINLYRQFLSQRKTAKTWDEPLVNFLRRQTAPR
ncbi:MAG: hypothetical protein LBE14_07770 [Treponema sp.]|jgi:hypothetical protein|nr:hypothetical protein [Treponema sp.]